MKSLNITNSNTCCPIDYKSLINQSMNDTIKICHDNFSVNWWHKLRIILINAISKTAKPCTINEYDGDLRTFYEYMPNDWHIQVDYTFKSDELLTRQEYLVTDETRLIGTVGGTMGLFIGFSFLDMLKKLMTIFKTYLLSYQSK